MTNLKTLTALSVFLALVLVYPLATALSQPDIVVIDNKKAYKLKERAKVVFTHGQHMSVIPDCKTCHHLYQGGKNTLDESNLSEDAPGVKCADCHSALTRKALPAGSDAPKKDLMTAYHKQCLTCHERKGTMYKEVRTGPRTCAGCHKNK